MAEADAVEAREIGAGLGGGDDVVGGDGVAGVGERDGDDDGALGFELIEGGVDSGADFGVQALFKIFGGNADSKAGG